jgi:hypothetical protein
VIAAAMHPPRAGARTGGDDLMERWHKTRRGPAADAPSERLEVTMGSLGVAVAQRLEAVSDLVLVQLDGPPPPRSWP